MIRQYTAYLLRWQASTPVLAACMWFLPGDTLVKTIAANLIGGLIFFWVDRWIFGRGRHAPKD